MSTNKLLTPDNHALLLIDHQYLQLLTLRSHEAAQVIGNVNHGIIGINCCHDQFPTSESMEFRHAYLLVE
jgi:hypothetical protein